MNVSTDAAMSGLEALLAGMDSPVQETPEAPALMSSGSLLGDLGLVSNAQSVTPDVPETPAEPERAAAPSEDKPKRKRAGKRSSKKAEQTEEAPQAAQEPAQGEETPAGEPEPQAAPEEPAKPREKRIYWGSDKLGRLQHKLAGDLDKFFLLKTADVELEPEAQGKVIAENKAKFKTLAKKVQNRATNLIELCGGKTERVNPVAAMLMRLLAKDRVLVTGDKGNIHQRLIGTYTPDTARAMGRSTLGALCALEIVIPGTEKQSFVPNPDSVFLALVSDKMGLSFVDVGDACDAEDAAEEKRLEALRNSAAVQSNADEVTPDPEDAGEEPITAETSSLIGEILVAAGAQGQQQSLMPEALV